MEGFHAGFFRRERAILIFASLPEGHLRLPPPGFGAWASFLFWLLGLLVPVYPAQQSALKEIKVPYAMSWGDSVDKVREMIHAVKATETGFTEKAPGKLTLEAKGLAVGDALLQKSIFVFRDGMLIEVELEYADAAWDEEKTLDFFDRTRRRIDERYGPGVLLVNKVKEHPADSSVPKEMTYTLIAYQWSQATVALELTFYSVAENDRSFRLVSLHYKMP